MTPDPRHLVNNALGWAAANRARVLTLVAVIAAVGFVAASAGYVLQSFTPAAQERVGEGDTGELTRLDTDEDGLPDIEENYQYGTDLFTPDSDGDGLPDGWEASHAHEDAVTGERCPDPLAFDAEADCDDDGLTNVEERAAGTHPNRWDTDGDAMADAWEVRGGLNPLDAGDASGDPDGDGLTNAREHASGTHPANPDTDGDALPDPAELDGNATLLGRRVQFTPTDPTRASTSGSGIPDGWLLYHRLPVHGADVAHEDPDGDALTNREEYLHARGSLGIDATTEDLIRRGLHPTDPDTDGDGMADGWEARYGLNPLDAGDASGDPDRDGLINREEAEHGTDPFNADSDADGIPDPAEIQGWAITVNGEELDVTSDPSRVDTDGDGLTDAEERDGRANVDGVPVVFPPTNPSSKDTDADGLDDHAEMSYPLEPPHALDPTVSDTDADGLSDYDEDQGWRQWRSVVESELSGDAGALDWVETAYPDHGEMGTAQTLDLFRPSGDLDADGVPNIVDPDSDGDDLNDGDEVDPPSSSGVRLPATRPYHPDTDGDGLRDGWEARYAQFDARCACWLLDPTLKDSDGDGALDGEEDFDDDGLDGFVFINRLEQQAGTNPTDGDTDDDCLRDGWEWYYSRVHVRVLRLDPLVADSPDPTVRLPYVNHHRVPAGAATSPEEAAAAVSLDADTGEAVARVWGPDQHPGGDYWIVEVEGEFALTLCLHQEHGTDPTHPDGDTDEDAMPDAWEIHRQTDPTEDDANADYDEDDVTNLHEYTADASNPDPARRSTNPRHADTDLGGTADGQELAFVAAGGGQQVSLSPLDPSDDAPDVDLDGDGVTTRDELCIGAGPDCVATDPLGFDTDGDGLLDGANVELDATDPAHRDLAARFLDAGVVWFAVEDTFRFYGEAAFCNQEGDACADPTRLDTDEDGMPDGWEAHYLRVEGGLTDPIRFGRDQASDGDAVPDGNEYEAGRPGDWDERRDGVWWIGTDPTRSDTDGDGAKDGPVDAFDAPEFADLDFDYDNDGLHDLNGEDPHPLFDHHNAGEDLTSDARRVWKWLDHPGMGALESHFGAVDGIARTATPHLDGDGDGVPDHADRVPVRVTITRLAPSDTVWVGEPLAVEGRVEVAEGPDEGLGVPGVTVLVNLGPRSAAAEDVACAGVTGAEGAFALTCSMRGPQSVALPSDTAVLMGQAGGTVSWTYDPLEDPAQDLGAKDVTVWTYATLQGATPPTARPGGGSATAVGAADAVAGSVTLATRTDLRFPQDLKAENGGELNAVATLLDGAGDPLPGRSVTLQWAGESVTVTTDEAGRATHQFAVPTYDAPGARDLHARFTDAGSLLGAENSTKVMVQFPASLAIHDVSDAVASKAITITGRYAGPDDEGVAGATVVAALGSGSGNTTTGADGAFELTFTVPPATAPGSTTVTVSTNGTDRYTGAQAEATVTVLRPVTFRLDPLPTATYYGGYTVGGVVVDNQGAPVRSLAGERVTVAVEWPPYYRGLAAVADGARAGGFRHEVPGPALSLNGTVPVTLRFLGTPFYAPAATQVDVRIEVPTTITAPPQEVAAGRTATIKGVVRAADGAAVADTTVNVTVGGVAAGATATDARGAFALDYAVPASQPLGPLPVELEAEPLDAYRGATATSVYTVVSGTDLEFPARNVTGKTAYLNGTLRDGAGRPLPGYPVHLTWGGEPVAVATTDGEGAFSAAVPIPPDAPPGPVEAVAEFPGVPGKYITARTEATYNILAQGNLQLMKVGRVILGEPFHVEGRLLSDTGAPVTGPKVKVYLDERYLGEEPVRYGKFTFDGYAADAEPGPATLRVVYPGDPFLRPSEAQVPVVVKRRANLELVELPDTLRPDGDAEGVVRLHDDAGNPIRNVTLLVRMGESGLPFKVRTGDDGTARFPMVAATNGSSLAVSVRYGGEGAYTEAAADRLVAVDRGPTTTEGLTIFGLAALIVAGVGAALLVAAARQRRRAVGEAHHILRQLESDLLEGNEYVAAVLLAYRRLVENARRFGISELESDTAREFGDALREQVPVDGRDLGALLHVFEEARYSEHVIGPEHRERAAGVLRRILQQLDDHAATAGGGEGA